jgi:hypothetical protein
MHHAYWAANMWAFYAAADIALALLLLRFGFPVEKAPSLMTGLVSLTCLPTKTGALPLYKSLDPEATKTCQVLPMQRCVCPKHVLGAQLLKDVSEVCSFIRLLAVPLLSSW